MEYSDLTKNGPCLETVKALHQTIVSLRLALEQSKTEILQLKQRAWPTDSVHDCLSALTIENHVLKTHLLNKQNFCCPGKEATRKRIKKSNINENYLNKDNNKVKEEKYPEISCDIDKSPNKLNIKQNNVQNILSSEKITEENFKEKFKNPYPEDTSPLDASSNESSKFSHKKTIQIKTVPEVIIASTDSEQKVQFEGITEEKNLVEVKYSDEEGREYSNESKNKSGKINELTGKKVYKKVKENEELTNYSSIKEKISIIAGNTNPHKTSSSLESLAVLESPSKFNRNNRNLTISKTVSFSNVADLGKIIKLHEKNLEFILIEAEELNNMTENSPNQSISSQDISKATESLPRIEPSLSVLQKSVSNPLVSSSQAISAFTGLDSRNPSVRNNKKQASIEGKNITSEVVPLEVKEPKLQNEENMEDDFLNVFDDSASSPSTVKERSLKLSVTDDNTNGNNYKQHDLVQNLSPQSELGQNEEVDDIELIFTTEETKESDFKEQLVPIESNENVHHLHPGNDTDQNLSFEISDRELDDDVFNETGDSSKCFECNSQMYNSKSDNSINQEERSLKSCYSCQDSSFENKSFDKEESFDQFEEKLRIVETDISKCGIIDVDFTVNRRNTCPNPLPYRPIIHREALGKDLNLHKGRPIVGHPSASRRDSGAQTDISALPDSFWRSESSLAHKVKVTENFATLPSKLPLPCSKIKLSEKTVEARRVLLSDIGFTSMVPELSRSADHLCLPNISHTPATTQYGQFLKTPDLYSPGQYSTSQRFNWTSTVSPMDMSRSQSRYSSIYPLSPPAPSRRCSAPVSPSRKPHLKQTSKVRFANGSLPELRVDWVSTGDSGDSTDSLVEEAESFLRRSIDCLSSRRDYHKIKGSRRASAPEPSRDNIPLDWQPFLPRTPHDLKHEHWVKVIVPGEGKVRGGRVRYIGPVAGQTETYVGVQLSTPDGHSDGVFYNRRYFSCEPHHAVFVPFKKVIMGWKP